MKLSRALENLTVVYLALEVIGEGREMGGIEGNQAGYLTNLIGHASANVILLARLYMVSHVIDVENKQNTRFEDAIVKFEEDSYGEQLLDCE